MIYDIEESMNSIIKRLGYTESNNLFYYNDLCKNPKLKAYGSKL